MHISPCQTATVYLLQDGTGLFSALPKGQNVCIINIALMSISVPGSPVAVPLTFQVVPIMIMVVRI